MGLDALQVAHPPGALAGEERFTLTAVRFGPDVTDTKAGMTPAELRESVTVVFLAGQRGDGQPLRRHLLGGWVEGKSSCGEAALQGPGQRSRSMDPSTPAISTASR